MARGDILTRERSVPSWLPRTYHVIFCAALIGLGGWLATRAQETVGEDVTFTWSLAVFFLLGGVSLVLRGIASWLPARTVVRSRTIRVHGSSLPAFGFRVDGVRFSASVLGALSLLAPLLGLLSLAEVREAWPEHWVTWLIGAAAIGALVVFVIIGLDPLRADLAITREGVVLGRRPWLHLATWGDIEGTVVRDAPMPSRYSAFLAQRAADLRYLELRLHTRRRKTLHSAVFRVTLEQLQEAIDHFDGSPSARETIGSTEGARSLAAMIGARVG